GVRAMGYYDFTDLPYYYSLATSFGTSDSWFAPVMTRTQPNRMYMMAATSAGRVYPLANGSPQLPNRTIFQSLDEKGIPWRIYVTDDQDVPITNGAELGEYTFSINKQSNFVSAKQFLDDLGKPDLPAVIEIDPGFNSGL